MAQNSFFFEHEDLKHGHALFSTGQVGVINKIENELQSIRKKTDFFGKAHSALFINFFFNVMEATMPGVELTCNQYRPRKSGDLCLEME